MFVLHKISSTQFFLETISNELTKYVLLWLKDPSGETFSKLDFMEDTNWQLSVKNTLKSLLRLKLGSGRKKWGKEISVFLRTLLSPWTILLSTFLLNYGRVYLEPRSRGSFLQMWTLQLLEKFHFCSSLTQSDFFGSGDINTDIAVEKSTDNVYDH